MQELFCFYSYIAHNVELVWNTQPDLSPIRAFVNRMNNAENNWAKVECADRYNTTNWKMRGNTDRIKWRHFAQRQRNEKKRKTRRSIIFVQNVHSRGTLILRFLFSFVFYVKRGVHSEQLFLFFNLGLRLAAKAWLSVSHVVCIFLVAVSVSVYFVLIVQENVYVLVAISGEAKQKKRRKKHCKPKGTR